MKQLFVFTGLMCLAGGACAAGFGELAVSAAQLKACKVEIPAPELIAADQLKTAGGMISDEADVKLVIKSAGELVPVVAANYAATKDSFFCTVLSMDDGSPRRVPKMMFKKIDQEKGAFDIPSRIESSCGYKRIGGLSLSFYIPGRAEAYNSIVISETGAVPAEQKVVCKSIPVTCPGGSVRENISCSGNIKLDTGNKAVIRVVAR